MNSGRDVALGEVAKIVRQTVDPRNVPGDTIYVGLESINSGGGLSGYRRASESALLSSKFEFKEGDVLFGKLRPYLAKITRPAFPGICSTDILPIRTGPHIRSDYLAFFLRHPKSVAWAAQRATGANLPRLGATQLEKLHVPLPALDLQRHIVEVLDSVDCLREVARSVIVQLHQLSAALFISMFGDPISGNVRWRVVPLSELGEIVTGNTPSRESPSSPTEAVPWVKSDNLRGLSVLVTEPAEAVSRYAVKRPRIVQDGAVLVTCIAGTPASIGNCAIADREVAFNQQINAIVPRGSESAFVYSYLQLAKRRVQALSTGGMKGMVSKARLSNLPVMMPPLKLQQDYGERFSRVACISEKAELRCSRFDALFASLQDRAFKGEL